MSDKHIQLAFSYVPAVLSQLDSDHKDMLTDIMQALLEIGIEQGRNEVFEDRVADKKGNANAQP